jgi:hypothetical protein
VIEIDQREYFQHRNAEKVQLASWAVGLTIAAVAIFTRLFEMKAGPAPPGFEPAREKNPLEKARGVIPELFYRGKIFDVKTAHP